MLAFPSKAIASNLNNNSNLNSLQEKVAKGYSDKFCNGIGMGISKEGAMRLTINENRESKFNPSLWFELISSGKENLEKIDEDRLAEVISRQIVNECGPAIGLSGQEGSDLFYNYFISVRDEIEN